MSRSLTKNQTMTIRGITKELSKRLKIDVTITDFLNSCLCETVFQKMTERITKANEIKKTEKSEKSSKKKKVG